MKIYFATTECALFDKRTKLANFSYSLPKELSNLGHDVRVVMPLYSWIKSECASDLVFEKHFYLSNNGVNKYVGIFSYKVDNLIYYFIDNEYYFSRESIEGFYDDSARFGYFCRALLEMLEEVKFYPDIIHLNDWNTAPSATLFKDSYIQRKNFYNTRIVFTIHSLNKQGIFPRYELGRSLSLNDSYFEYDKLEDYGNINYLKAGLTYADVITTGSKTYANNIRHDENSMNLSPALVYYAYKIFGVENGIDYEMYNPKTDDNLFYTYSKEEIDKKADNKIELQKMLGIRKDKDIPIICYVGDLVNDKGVDLISFIFDEMMEEDIEFIVLGRGESNYQDEFIHYSHKYRDKVSTNIFYSNSIARKVFAAADILITPSRVEPSAVTHLIAMRYGCVPLVREVGVLSDTVIKYDSKTKKGNGFTFSGYNAHELIQSIKEVLHYYKKKDVWKDISKQAMERDSSWVRTAKEYERIYEEIGRNNYE